MSVDMVGKLGWFAPSLNCSYKLLPSGAWLLSAPLGCARCEEKTEAPSIDQYSPADSINPQMPHLRTVTSAACRTEVSMWLKVANVQVRVIQF